ncbi:MAG TPA: HPr family phosphocarrier protein [Savagea sp.]
MEREVEATVRVQIDEKITIVDISNAIQAFDSEVYISKTVNGAFHEINLKSFLGLITLQLHNGDLVTLRTVGTDSEETFQAVLSYLGERYDETR